ncbi:MAG: hypothetical protein MHM6MM_003100 [Cercozoa sp. M6MM]
MPEHKFHAQYSANGRAGCKDSKCKQKIAKGALRLAREVPNPFDEDNEESTMMKWYHATCFFRAQKRVRKDTRKLESMSDFEEEPEIEDEDKELLKRLIKGEMLWETTDATAFRSMKETPELLGAEEADEEAEVGKKRTKKQTGGDAKRRKTSEVEVTSHALDGVRVALSGKVEGYTQKAFEQLLQSAGGSLSKSVTRTCVALVVGDKGEGTTKYEKASEMELPLVTPDWAIDSVNDNEKKPFEDYTYGGEAAADEEDEEEQDEEEQEEEEEEEEEKSAEEDEDEEETAGGDAAVDSDVPKASTFSVYSDDDCTWHAMTQQPTKNGHKYYLLQLLKAKDGKFHTFFKWGALGGRVSGTTFKEHKSVDEAKKFFCKQFKSKTKNEWPIDKSDFKAYAKKYALV